MKKLLLIVLLSATLIIGCAPKISKEDYLATSDALKTSRVLTAEAAPSRTPKPTLYSSQRTAIAQARLDPVEIIEKSCTRGSIMHCEGRVRNNSSVSFRYVQLRITVLTAGGAVVGVEDWYIDSDVLLPGATSSWDGFVRGASEATKYKVEVWDFMSE